MTTLGPGSLRRARAWRVWPLGALLAGLGLTFATCKRTPTSGSTASAISAHEGPHEGQEEGQNVCSKIACQDELRITVTAEDKAIPPGLQRIDVTVDSTELSCAFTLPTATPGETLRTITAECQPGLTVDVGPATLCTTTRNANSVSQTCTPVPGRIKETLRVVGMPRLVKVTQVVGARVQARPEGRPEARPQDRPVFERSDTPRYGLMQPNGPGCDPICHLAVLDWTIP